MAKRASLREFQEQFAAKLGAAKRGVAVRTLLGMESGRIRWLVDLSDSGEVVPLPQLTPVPLVKDWFAGIANIRGDLYSVVDFSAFQGKEPTPRNADARLLLIGARHSINSALLINRTLGLKKAESFSAEAAPADGPPWVHARYTDDAGGRWFGLDTAKLIELNAFLDIGRAS